MLGASFSWAGCSCGDSQSNASSGGPECQAPECTTLEPGLIGAYTSVAVTGNTLWVAGYSEAWWIADGRSGNQYGDLVVGKWNGKKVDWKQVDGVPSEPKVDGMMYNVNGFRGGQTEPGDDVGIWTSIALDAKGDPAVAYYDRTNKALKFARNLGGNHWDVITVDSKAKSDVGRYAKLLAMNGGWAIAYQSIEPGGDNGAALSRVRLASTTSSTPTAGEWTIEDVAVDKNTPCRVDYCSGGEVCDATTKRCTTPAAANKCKPACGSSTACIESGGTATCTAILDQNKIDSYPDAIGDYIAMAPAAGGGVGIVYYDRPLGNLMAAVKEGSSWKNVLVDGENKMGGDNGDTGIGASLAIDTTGTWHVTYVEGLTEALKYVKLSSSLNVTGGPEIIDDGQVLNGVQNNDGQHLIGDDSNVFVTSSGEVHVSYADSTAGQLRYAVGVPMGSNHKWSVQVIDQKGRFAGAFSHVIELNGSTQVVNWWRTGGHEAVGDVDVVKP
jgi:hypothetical protein